MKATVHLTVGLGGQMGNGSKRAQLMVLSYLLLTAIHAGAGSAFPPPSFGSHLI